MDVYKRLENTFSWETDCPAIAQARATPMSPLHVWPGRMSFCAVHWVRPSCVSSETTEVLQTCRIAVLSTVAL